MSKQIQIQAFNAKFIQLLDFFAKKFPNDREISYALTQMDSAVTLTPKLPALHFMKEIFPYIDHLYERNEDFLLELKQSKYADVLGHLSLDEKWKLMSEPDRDYFWSTTKSLHRLGEKIMDL